MRAPCSAAILHASDRYLASRAISLPTAVTARTGTPYSSASSTSLPRFTTVCRSCLAPTNTDIARALAPSLSASRMPTVICSSERSSPMMEGPPDTRSTTGTRELGLTHARSTPRVSMSESQCCTRGRTVLAGFSSRSVGPRK